MESLEQRVLLSLSLVADINPQTLSSSPGPVFKVGNNYVLAATNGLTGNELYRTDLTDAGTQVLSDIYPGTGSSSPTWLTPLGGVLIFYANSPTLGYELYKTDGSTAGTTLIKDINPGSASSGLPQISSGFASTEMVSFNGKIFFNAIDSSHGQTLWATDGTTEGTAPVPGSFGSTVSSLSNLTVIGDSLYFIAVTSLGREIWKFDGPSQALIRLTNLTSSASRMSNLVGFNGSIAFWTDCALWLTDASPQGATSIYNRPSCNFTPTLATSKGVLFLRNYQPETGYELWKSDGTPQGTQLLKDIRAGSDSSSPSYFRDFHGRLVFGAINDTTGVDLWSSDGTPEGTQFLTNIRSSGVNLADPFPMIEFNDHLLFAGTDAANGVELWQTDGTPGGTSLVGDLNPGSASSNPGGFQIYNNQLYFLGTESSVRKLWVSDGSAQNTTAVAASGFDAITPANYYIAGGNFFFNAKQASIGNELFFTDGQSPIALVKDINTDTDSSSPSTLVRFAGRYFFTATDTVHGRELWSTDGTPQGTSLFFETRPGPLNGALDLGISLQSEGRYGTSGFVAGDYLYFLGYDSAGISAIWRTDGTVDGTIRLAPFFTPSITIKPIVGMAALGNLLLFANAANASIADTELWVSDGTPQGTHVIKDILPGAGSSISGFQSLAVLNNAVYFFAFDNSGSGVWKTDGTANGTQRVKQIQQGSDTSIITHNGMLYFAASDAGFGNELWKSDGTAAGTVRVSDINPNAASSNPTMLTPFKNWIFFAAADSSGAKGMWRSDGTAAGTTLFRSVTTLTGLRVTDSWLYYSYISTSSFGTTYGISKNDGVNSGFFVSSSSNLCCYLTPATDGDREFFVAASTGGSQLWQPYAGAVAGGAPINGPVNLTSPSNAVWLDGALYFSASSSQYGAELWKLISPTMALDGTKGRTISFTLSDDITGNLTVNPILKSLQFGYEYAMPPMVFDLANHKATFTIPEPAFSGPFSLTFPASSIVDSYGNPLARDFTYYFYATTNSAACRVEFTATDMRFYRTATGLEAIVPLSQLNAIIVTSGAGNRTLTLSNPLPASVSLDLATVTAIIPTTANDKAAALAAARAAVASGQISSFILNGNANRKLAITASDTSISIRPSLIGDLNFDNTVSIADFITLAANLGATDATWAQGDLNDDQLVTISDFIDLSSHFAQSFSASAASPQPPESSVLASADDKAALSVKALHRARKHPHHRKHSHSTASILFIRHG